MRLLLFVSSIALWTPARADEADDPRAIMREAAVEQAETNLPTAGPAPDAPAPATTTSTGNENEKGNENGNGNGNGNGNANGNGNGNGKWNANPNARSDGPDNRPDRGSHAAASAEAHRAAVTAARFAGASTKLSAAQPGSANGSGSRTAPGHNAAGEAAQRNAAANATQRNATGIAHEQGVRTDRTGRPLNLPPPGSRP